MTQAELRERCKNRNFDQIVVVVNDVFQELANMQRIQKAVPGDIRFCTEHTDPGLTTAAGSISYSERRASCFYANTEICIVQPVEGETVYRQFLNRFGEGICCVRERVPAADYRGMEERFRAKGLNIAQRMESEKCHAFWLDLTEQLGILYEVISDDSDTAKPLFRMDERIAQINITTPNVRKTIETAADLLEIGPWEVGRQSNAVVDRPGFRVDGELKDAQFSFLLAILVCGNIEWEAIQPEKGPLVYYDFLKRRGIGFHHVLQEIPEEKWSHRLSEYEDAGVQMSCKGTLGPVDWCYMDTEKDLHFFMELRTDAKMEKLPDGYLQYFYPDA